MTLKFFKVRPIDVAPIDDENKMMQNEFILSF